MKTRILRVLLFIAIATVFTGCPAGNEIRTGTWLFTFADDFSTGQPTTLAVTLVAGGTAEHDFPTLPADADGILGPTLDWEQQGETFLMTQGDNVFVFQFLGAVLSRTLIQGTVMQTNGNLSTSFVASWVER